MTIVKISIHSSLYILTPDSYVPVGYSKVLQYHSVIPGSRSWQVQAMDADATINHRLQLEVMRLQNTLLENLDDHSFDTPAPATGPPDNLDDHSFDTPASSTGQPDNLALTTRPGTEPRLSKKRRRLAYVKCHFCRGAKKKVSIVPVCCPLTQEVSNNLMYLVRAPRAPMARRKMPAL